MNDPLRITLRAELPNPGLFWNRRTHHQKLARLKRESRRVGWLIAEEAIRKANLPEVVLWKGYILEPHYNNNRRRDDDNLAGACKGLLDGIFNDFLHIDDSTVRCLGVEPTIERKVKPFLLIHLLYYEL